MPQIKITGSAKDSAENLLLIAKNFEKDRIIYLQMQRSLKKSVAVSTVKLFFSFSSLSFSKII